VTPAPEQALSFGKIATAYAHHRPSYPEAAVGWLLEGAGPRVIDLGAGTGLLTRLLVARGLDVAAVEPSAGMRSEFVACLPGVEVLDGAAERIPLPDASVDAVVVAQAWHWADPTIAGPEVARVLRPGGRLGLVWNIRDERVPWVAALGRIMHRGPEREMESDRPTVGPPFAPIERFDVPWVDRITPDGLVELVGTRSYILTATERRRRQVLAEVRELLASDPELAGRDLIDLPYVTRCSRTGVPA
jgi:SAM-dependent methyltransferase